MSIRSKIAARHGRLGSFERLEPRDVLSANLGLGNLAASAHAAAHELAGRAPAVEHVELSIIGTEVSYNPAGLPSDMKGDLYLMTASGSSTHRIGTYDESLQPIFAPVGPGGSLAFVGATGVCTFDFNLSFGKAGSITLGSILASDTALIEGALSDGTLLVGSSNSPVIASTGIFAGLSGSFNGQSEVVMGATFSMRTEVDFVVHRSRGISMKQALGDLAMANDAIAHGDFDSHLPKASAVDSDRSQAAWSTTYHRADKDAIVGSIFANEAQSFSTHPLDREFTS